MTNIDYKQYVKEKVLEHVSSWGLTDEKVFYCMRFFTEKLLFLSTFETKSLPAFFGRHVELWSLEAGQYDYILYCSEMASQYMRRGDIYTALYREKAVEGIKMLLKGSLICTLIPKIGLNRGDTTKLKVLYEKVSALVKYFLEHIQQHVKKNASNILAMYRGRKSVHEKCIKHAWMEHCPERYLLSEEHSENKKGKEFEADDVDPNLKVIIDILHAALHSLMDGIKRRSVSHLKDVLDLCIDYPDETYFLPPEYWVDKLTLTQIKKIHSLVTEKVIYQDYLPDANLATIDRCQRMTSEIIRNMVGSIKKQCVKELQKQIVSYKKREMTARDANASSLGLMSRAVVKSSLESSERKKQQEEVRKKKSVSWLLSDEKMGHLVQP